MEWLNNLNTTSFRIVSTVGLTYLTGFRYMASGLSVLGVEVTKWTPAPLWLLFIWGMAGVEGAVLVAKRLSDYEFQRIKAGANQPSVNVETAEVKTEKIEVTTTPQSERTGD